MAERSHGARRHGDGYGSSVNAEKHWTEGEFYEEMTEFYHGPSRIRIKSYPEVWEKPAHLDKGGRPTREDSTTFVNVEPPNFLFHGARAKSPGSKSPVRNSGASVNPEDSAIALFKSKAPLGTINEVKKR